MGDSPGTPSTPTGTSDKDLKRTKSRELKRTASGVSRTTLASATSHTSRRSRRKSRRMSRRISRVGGGSIDVFQEGGLIEDETGVHFHFRKDDLYEFPTRRKSRRSTLFEQGFGAGLAGPLIAHHLISKSKSKADKVGEGDDKDDKGEGEGGAAEGRRKARPKIGLIGCIGVIIGCVLGSGIFAAPQAIQSLTESCGMTLIIWFSYGMIALIGALCYVELGCTIPVSGGDYAYLNECFGPLPAFLFQWATNFIIVPTVCAILASVVSKNLVNPYVDPGDVTKCYVVMATRLLAMMLIMGVVYINSISSELTAKIQGYLMMINITTIFLIILCGIIHMGRFGIENQKDWNANLPPGDKKTQVLKLVQAMYQASFSYLGYSYVTYIMEDVDNPIRTLPIAICISIPLVIFLNVFVNFCYLASVKMEALKNTQTIASEMLRSVVKDPKSFPGGALWIAPSLVAVAVMGGFMSNVLTCSRVSYIGARNGHFPKIFAMTHMESMTPVVSLAFMGCLGCGFVFLEIPVLIGMLTFIVSSFNCSVIYGLIFMRIRRPDLPRPFKMPLFVPITYAVISTFLFITPIVLLDIKKDKKGNLEKESLTSLTNIGGGIFVLFSGIPVYFLFVHKGRKWRCCQIFHGEIKKFIQKMWLVLPEDEDIDDNQELEVTSIASDDDE